jgi:hypothetical protein
MEFLIFFVIVKNMSPFISPCQYKKHSFYVGFVHTCILKKLSSWAQIVDKTIT